MAPKNPKTVTIYGRLSFPRFTAQEAFTASQSGKYPAKDVASAKPEFNLVLEQPQLDKFLAHVKDVFFPYCIEQSTKGEKRDVLTAAEVKKLTDGFKDLEDQMFNTPLKAVGDKTLALAPNAVATLKAIGNAGQDIELRAIVESEDELDPVDPDQVKFPVIKPLHVTVHQMYPGAQVAVTLNLYAYHNDPKRPGFGAGASVAVFKADDERFGGGASVDEDEIFLD
jgi:hypothetical protein